MGATFLVSGLIIFTIVVNDLLKRVSPPRKSVQSAGVLFNMTGA